MPISFEEELSKEQEVSLKSCSENFSSGPQSLYYCAKRKCGAGVP
jgi:hypothetical protein